MVSTYIIGGSGYTGSELLRILSNHPKVDEITVTSRQLKGEDVSKHLPHIHGDLKFEDVDVKKANKADFVFACVPHTKAMELVPKLKNKVIDLSADFRLKDVGVFEATYKVKHTAPELIPEAVYGLPELHRTEIKKARLVANPGCMATSVILALWPLVKNFEGNLAVCDCKTGISGAGKAANDRTHFGNVNETVTPYKIASHRHIAEMVQELDINVFFTPHVVPLTRGILTSVHAFVQGSTDKVAKVYEDAYKDEPFTKVVDGVPSILAVRGSNYCQVGGFTQDGDRLVLFSAIDNLVKGASGQAVQNMNLMAGFKETLGLEQLAIAP